MLQARDNFQKKLLIVELSWMNDDAQQEVRHWFIQPFPPQLYLFIYWQPFIITILKKKKNNIRHVDLFRV